MLLRAKDAPNNHPDYNAYELMAFLTVKYHQFEYEDYEDIEDDLRDIFNEQ